ncbi:MAG: TIM barrel protein [Planctomycetes bacterium]|jgi:sugar phosphate isomerase/epimerase|nr:TIM barrel protein [Planctomycetota bacterium]
MSKHPNNYPKLHNATWPGMVGKGGTGPNDEPFIDFDTMLDMTAKADVDGVKFDGIDIFLFDPHLSIDASDDVLKQLADKVRAKNLTIGSLVAPVWGPTGGGSAFGSDEDRAKFIGQVKKSVRIANKLKELGVRSDNLIRIDSSGGPADWAKDPAGNTKKIADTFREAGQIAKDNGERLAAEGEICWGGMQSWRKIADLFEKVNMPGVVGMQSDMAHTLLFLMGYNAPEDALLPEGYDWKDKDVFYAAYKKMTDVLRPWTLDFHVAQNDGTVKGQGSHDKTGRHCLAKDPNGKLEITKAAGYWLRDDKGQVTKAVKHLCWDGCMFPNAVMKNQQTWNDILAAMLAVRDAHGWQQAEAAKA